MTQPTPTGPGNEQTFEQLIQHHLQHLMLQQGHLTLHDATTTSTGVFMQLQHALSEQIGTEQAHTLMQQALQWIRHHQHIPNR